MQYTFMNDTPVGRLLVAGDTAGLRYVLFDDDAAIPSDWVESDDLLAEPVRQLTAYFSGELREFRIQLAGQGTEFQRRVWQELLKVPYGSTASYGQIAAAIGQPKASRAVGAANGRNPISIIVPCHRIIGSTGNLVGYGGGPERKRTLLALEGISLK
ncbi:MAG: methylated-DNA--[protein]-cysteine S-methyltransferase [Planctomycetaceae bacterium]|nr:methylated-DNA--[protein]-cysteine S-methyltransferase [Planctomycetaceae bacterium]